MKLKTRTAVLSALAVFGVATFTAPAVLAQDGTHGAHSDAQRGDARRGDMRARFEAMRQQHEAQRAQDLRTILRLRPEQEPALTAFLASHKRPDHPMGAGPDGRHGPPPAGGAPQGLAPMTTLQHLDMEAKREAEMTAMRQKHIEALRTFYAALSPDQRQVFDALQRMGHGHGGGEHGPHGFGGHGFGRGPMGGPPPGGPGRGDE